MPAGGVASIYASGHTATLWGFFNILDEVVVTGTCHAEPVRLLPYAVSVVGTDKLETAGHTQVLSILSGMAPSLFVTQRSVLGFGVSSGGGNGQIKRRGVGGDRARGVELAVQSHAVDNQVLYASYSYLHTLLIVLRT